MARSRWKGPFVEEWLIHKVNKAKEIVKSQGFAKPIWARRNNTIIPNFVGLAFHIHNGKALIELPVRENMIGHKFGEFVPTRKFVQHSGDRKNDSKAKKR